MWKHRRRKNCVCCRRGCLGTVRLRQPSAAGGGKDARVYATPFADSFAGEVGVRAGRGRPVRKHSADTRAGIEAPDARAEVLAQFVSAPVSFQVSVAASCLAACVSRCSAASVAACFSDAAGASRQGRRDG